MPAWSGLYDGVGGAPHALLAQTIEKENGYTQLSRLFANRLYGRAALREVIYSLVDGAVGDNATATHKRRVSEVDRAGIPYGGKATIETFTAINRVTTATDETAVLAALRQSAQPSSYPADRSGNGGGSKLGV